MINAQETNTETAAQKPSTIETLFLAIEKMAPSRHPNAPLVLTEAFQQFIDDNKNNNEALTEALEIFIHDRNLPIDSAQYNILLNAAAQLKRADVLLKVPHGLDRMLITAIKNGVDTKTIYNRLMLARGAKLNITITDHEGNTALENALSLEKPDVTLIQYLLDFAIGAENFKPILLAFLNSPPNENMQEVWNFLHTRFQCEYADTEEETPTPQFSLDLHSQEFITDDSLLTLANTATLFAPTAPGPLRKESAAKRLKLG